MNKVWFWVGIVFFLVILTLYLRRERYEEPQAPVQQAPVQQAVNNPALESLKEKFKACGQDKVCIQRVAMDTVLAQQVMEKNNK